MDNIELIKNPAVILYFTSNECNVCKVLLPKVKEMAQNKYPEFTFHTIKADEDRKMAATFEVFTVPVILVFFEGKEFYRKARNISIIELEREISRPYHLLFD